MSDAEEAARWNELVHAARMWADRHMDQWEMFSFLTQNGPIYVTITRQVEDPNLFESMDRTRT